MRRRPIKYQAFIQRELKLRRARNPHYSLRSFARDIDLHPGRLSSILREKGGLSPSRAKEIAPKLRLNQKEQELFCLLVASHHARNHQEREVARRQLANLSSEYCELSEPDFENISDWHYFAITELAHRPDAQSDAKWFAKQLEISEEVVEEAIDQLLAQGLLTLDSQGQLKPSAAGNRVGGRRSSHAIRNFHSQILRKAEKSILDEEMTRRYPKSHLYRIAHEDLPEVRQRIDRFLNELRSFIEQNPKRQQLHCIHVSQFELTKGEDP